MKTKFGIVGCGFLDALPSQKVLANIETALEKDNP